MTMADLEASGVHEEAGILPREVHGEGRGPSGAGRCHPTRVGEGSRGTRPLAQEVPQERSVSGSRTPILFVDIGRYTLFLLSLVCRYTAG